MTTIGVSPMSHSNPDICQVTWLLVSENMKIYYICFSYPRWFFWGGWGLLAQPLGSLYKWLSQIFTNSPLIWGDYDWNDPNVPLKDMCYSDTVEYWPCALTKTMFGFSQVMTNSFLLPIFLIARESWRVFRRPSCCKGSKFLGNPVLFCGFKCMRGLLPFSTTFKFK